MDLQFYGANCLSMVFKGIRIVIDDNLADLGGKSPLKTDDVALFTGPHGPVNARLTIDGPGEYEVADISIIGLPSQAHIDEKGTKNATMFKLIAGETTVLVTGHLYPELTDKQLEAIGIVDVLAIPVGGNGYTLDPLGALKLIKVIEPKLVIPTHYADGALNFPVPQQELSNALTELGIEQKEAVTKLRIRPNELSDVTQLVILEKT
jgi:L-ascorbate metabolism protein UlaG (beta-lactamase superfamily)